jgi:Domain of unknown function (DUF4345)
MQSAPATKTLQLKVSVVVILTVALGYGFYLNKIFPAVFDFVPATTDLKNIFRATMGLYLAMVIVWIAGIIKERLWLTATISNIAFMGGLALGRIISLLTDGIPSAIFLFGIATELLLACWGIFNLTRNSST